MFFSDPANPERDVLVTGIGLVTPLGIGSDVSFRQLLSGATAGRLLTPDDIDHFHELQALLKRVPGGAPADASAARDFVQEYLRTEGTPVLRHHRGKPLSAGVADDEDLLNIITMAAAAEAVQQSGLSTAHLQTEIAGCVIGTSKASLRSLETRHLLNFADSPLQAVRRLWALAGSAFSPVAACATGLVSVLHGSLLIHSGACEICLVGSADASVRASVLASFHRLGVTSNHPDPATACRPFDENRDGFIVGEGAGVLVLESRRHAEARSATSLGTIVAGGWLTDPTGLTQIDREGEIVSRLVADVCSRSTDAGTASRATKSERRTMACKHPAGQEKDAPDRPMSPDFINVHGTATETNDLAEGRGLHRVFGADGVPPVTAFKGAIGHLLRAAGSVELALTLMCLREGRVPKTANLNLPDPQCRITPVASTQSITEARTALKVSLGFGGHVAACLLSR